MILVYRGVPYEVNIPSIPVQIEAEPAASQSSSVDTQSESQTTEHNSSQSNLIDQQSVNQASMEQSVAEPQSQTLEAQQKMSNQTMEQYQNPQNNSGFSLRAIARFFNRERVLKPMVIQAYNHQEVTYWYKGNQVRLTLDASGEAVQSVMVRGKNTK
ncbi:MAG: hypothetical protein ACFBSC_17120 [Microcoleaceae cyanobacterium]